jgi:hypothetical protein
MLPQECGTEGISKATVAPIDMLTFLELLTVPPLDASLVSLSARSYNTNTHCEGESDLSVSQTARDPRFRAFTCT